MWIAVDVFKTAIAELKAQISDFRNQMEAAMTEQQDQLDALVTAVQTGVQELRDEITRLDAVPAGEKVDFTRLQGLADALASDNIPAAPVEPPVVEPPAPA